MSKGTCTWIHYNLGSAEALICITVWLTARLGGRGGAQVAALVVSVRRLPCLSLILTLGGRIKD